MKNKKDKENIEYVPYLEPKITMKYVKKLNKEQTDEAAKPKRKSDSCLAHTSFLITVGFECWRSVSGDVNSIPFTLEDDIGFRSTSKRILR